MEFSITRKPNFSRKSISTFLIGSAGSGGDVLGDVHVVGHTKTSKIFEKLGKIKCAVLSIRNEVSKERIKNSTDRWLLKNEFAELVARTA